MRIKGRIFSGLGKGAFFTQLDWVKQQCQEKLDFAPFPGTLNLKVTDEYLEVLRKLKGGEGIALVPPTAEYCQARCYPVFIGSVKAAIVIPHAENFTSEMHPQNVIEIIAPVNVKAELSIKDGDELTLEMEG